MVLHAATETLFLATLGTNSAKSLATDFATTLPGFCESSFVTNSIAARITPNGAYRQAVVQAAMRHAVKA